MSAQPLPTPTVPPSFGGEKPALLARLVDGLDASGLWWLSGYAAGLAQLPAPPALALLPGGAGAPRATVLYGSQTGNARRAAERLVHDLEGAGLAARLVRADAFPTRDLVTERLLYIVISTQGDGDPPDDAIGFVEFLCGKRAPALSGLKFAVLGLGDSSYAQFCGIARRIDARLAELGATRLFAAGEADLDVDTVAQPWSAAAVDHARALLTTAATAPNVTALRPPPAPSAWTRERPFAAGLLANQRLSGRNSAKDVRHIELSLAGSGLRYEPGDALGVWQHNPPAVRDAVLDVLGLDGDVVVTHDGIALPLSHWLQSRRELTRLSRPFLAAHATLSASAELDRLLAPAQQADCAALLASHQLIDVLRRWPAAWSADALVAALRSATPRLYSIASSQKEVGDEAHLTVDVLGYEAFGHVHVGAASRFLADLCDGDSASVFIEPNERFRVPTDASRDIVMIGPGTGVAPFRGFVQERRAAGARGRAWLFFGAQQFRDDFLYQTEWQEALRRADLQRLDLAFSRDQAERLYVQQRLRERGRDLFDWLDGGAHLYVCGSIAMGRDVHAALLDVIATQRGGDADSAHAYLAQLQSEGRYSRDVY
ncbi:assimilatory sulfite reductase (NADPH) flavoprotein subunit [Chiayiivirga flava]|uniref:assimilatory sulfite reductase (NADPH) n=1 Tax=Chiayiivirga flava TaxID=659595 RepID=A0A7W8G2P1_9GAMM|nr:assimilatory sulfite reductase (NADPH) flavoprotein subunit [Chiayiivirga flava]MBB5208910.1 sulfite reductase (NADPH) flavoprotein alpha-component [Chiayiivirga flava]